MYRSENEMLNEYKEIPGFSEYLINKDGKIFSKKSNAIIKTFRDKAGYYYLGMTNDEGVRKRMCRHRLLCLVYKNLDINDKNVVVNHINGIKGDDRLSNLECVTVQENNEHAGKIGISPKCLPVKVYNHFTHEEYYFPSAKKAGTYLGISKDAVLWRIHHKKGVIINGIEMKLVNDKTPWAVLDFGEYGYLGKTIDDDNGNIVIIEEVLDNRLLVFSRQEYAARHLNVASSVITQLLKRDRLYLHLLKGKLYRIQYLKGSVRWPPIDDVYLNLAEQGYPIPFCYNDVDKKVFLSCIDCAKAMGISPTCLNNRLQSNFKSVFKDGFRYGYYIDYINHGPDSE